VCADERLTPEQAAKHPFLTPDTSEHFVRHAFPMQGEKAPRLHAAQTHSAAEFSMDGEAVVDCISVGPSLVNGEESFAEPVRMDSSGDVVLVDSDEKGRSSCLSDTDISHASSTSSTPLNLLTFCSVPLENSVADDADTLQDSQNCTEVDPCASQCGGSSDGGDDGMHSSSSESGLNLLTFCSIPAENGKNKDAKISWDSTNAGVSLPQKFEVISEMISQEAFANDKELNDNGAGDNDRVAQTCQRALWKLPDTSRFTPSVCEQSNGVTETQGSNSVNNSRTSKSRSLLTSSVGNSFEQEEEGLLKDFNNRNDISEMFSFCSDSDEVRLPEHVLVTALGEKSLVSVIDLENENDQHQEQRGADPDHVRSLLVSPHSKVMPSPNLDSTLSGSFNPCVIPSCDGTLSESAYSTIVPSDQDHDCDHALTDGRRFTLSCLTIRDSAVATKYVMAIASDLESETEDDIMTLSENEAEESFVTSDTSGRISALGELETETARVSHSADAREQPQSERNIEENPLMKLEAEDAEQEDDEVMLLNVGENGETEDQKERMEKKVNAQWAQMEKGRDENETLNVNTKLDEHEFKGEAKERKGHSRKRTNVEKALKKEQGGEKIAGNDVGIKRDDLVVAPSSNKLSPLTQQMKMGGVEKNEISKLKTAEGFGEVVDSSLSSPRRARTHGGTTFMKFPGMRKKVCVVERLQYAHGLKHQQKHAENTALATTTSHRKVGDSKPCCQKALKSDPEKSSLASNSASDHCVCNGKCSADPSIPSSSVSGRKRKLETLKSMSAKRCHKCMCYEKDRDSYGSPLKRMSLQLSQKGNRCSDNSQQMHRQAYPKNPVFIDKETSHAGRESQKVWCDHSDKVAGPREENTMKWAKHRSDGVETIHYRKKQNQPKTSAWKSGGVANKIISKFPGIEVTVNIVFRGNSNHSSTENDDC
jgi:hypothetical protein